MRASKKISLSKSAQTNLSDRLALLSVKRQEVVRPILEHPGDYVLLSVRALAKKLGTDPATVVRIVRGLGFASYKEFQHHLHDLSVAFATSLDSMRTSAVKDSSISGHLRECFEQDMKNLHGLSNSLDAKRMAAIAKRLCAARNIVVLAGDLASSLAKFFEYEAMLLGLRIIVGDSPGRVTHIVRTLGKEDAVIAISFRRGLRQTVEGLQQARDNGAYCLGITDTYVSPVARFSNEVVLASVTTPSFGASYVAPMALLNAILVACSNVRRGRTLALVKLADEEQRKGYRWYIA